jgi:predicted signal transduction protein with EAL and GGDEF domain
MGGDEFTILLPELTQPEDATIIAEKVIEELRRPLSIAGHEIRATASIGVALYHRWRGRETLIKHADIAMYHVKAAGRTIRSSPRNERDFHQRLTVENDLCRALGQELELRYQPQISLSRRQLVGMEALVRWRHPSQGLLDPARFIGVAEEAGLISRISDWVLDEVCAQLRRWRGLGFGDLRVGVNLSPREFEKGDVAERVFAALERHRVAPQALEIEITENLMIRDVDGGQHAAPAHAECAELDALCLRLPPRPVRARLTQATQSSRIVSMVSIAPGRRGRTPARRLPPYEVPVY